MKETVNLYSGTKVRLTEKILVSLFIYQAVGGGGGETKLIGQKLIKVNFQWPLTANVV